MSKKERAIILEFLVLNISIQKKDNDEKFCSDTIDWISALCYPPQFHGLKKKKNPN